VKKIILLIYLSFLVVPFSYAYSDDYYGGEDSPEKIRLEAFNDIKVAQQLMDEASQMLEKDVNRQKIELAINLYLKAGQIFEKVSKVFRMLGRNFVGQADQEGADQAMETCLTLIKDLKERLKQYK